jgi:endonuclease/exonuclease/phosphatase (EEP) superfamily protein YafD
MTPSNEESIDPRRRSSAWSLQLAVPIFLLLVVVAIEPLARRFFLVDLVANLRLQLLIGLSVVSSICLLRRRWIDLGLVVTAIVVAAIPIFMGLTYNKATAPTVAKKDSSRLTVTTLNILSHNRNVSAVIEHLRQTNSDVFALLEITTTWDETIRSEFRDSHPHQFSIPSDAGNFGIGLYSKYAFEKANELNFSVVPSIEVTFRDLPVRLVATHPIPPMSAKNFELRNQHLFALAEHLNTTEPLSFNEPLSSSDSPSSTLDDSKAMIVMGDFNLTPWAPIYRDWMEKLKLRRLAPDSRFQPTWYAGNPIWPRGLAIDHILVSDSLQPLEVKIGPDVGSDHRSVTATLAY